MTAIIDVESFIYKACTLCEEVIETTPGIYQLQWDINRVDEYFGNLLTDIMGTTDQSTYVFAFGDYKNYRKIINPDYKANRKEQPKHPMLSVIKGRLLDKYCVAFMEWVEADDVCRIMYEQDPVNNVIVSIDKDLKTFPCEIYNPMKPELGVQRITKKQGDENFFKQIVMGDKTDGYSGLTGYGEVKAARLVGNLDKLKIDELEQSFLDAGGNISMFMKNYNMAHILSRKDYIEGKGIQLYKGCFDFEKEKIVERL